MANTTYLGYHYTVSPIQPGVEILIAQLGEVGFESFVETPKGVIAYIQKTDHDGVDLREIQIFKNKDFSITYEIEEIEQENWNAVWEHNFKPIVVDDICVVRAPFHEKMQTQFDIIIEPKMSFGTGHHETTHMMIQWILNNNFNNKKVLDMGCGTGVLAILAEKKGASSVEAIDIDAWCYINAKENIERNACHKISAKQGDVSLLENQNYDIILANINRNILLQDIPQYSTCLDPQGLLFLSGFYSEDISKLEEVCQKHSLYLDSKMSRRDWISLKFIKR